MRFFFSLTFLVLSMGLAQGASTYTLEKPSAVFSFLISKKLILVEGVANQQTGYFLFDTGASELILNKRHFPDSHSSRLAHRYADSGGHGTSNGSIYVDQFNWSGLKRAKFFAPCLELDALEAELEIPLLGIIGYDVLRHIEVDVDYYRSQMTIRQPDTKKPFLLEREPDYHFTFQMEGHLPILNATLGKAEGLRMGIDSGSSMNICTRPLRKKIKDIALENRSIKLHGPGGRIETVDYYTLESLQVENAYAISYARVAFNGLDAFRDYGIHIDGLLGVNLFRLGKVQLSYASHSIAIWVEPNEYTLRYNTLALPKGMSAE